MDQMNGTALARLSRRDGRQLFRHVLGSAVIFGVWLALWAWVAIGVVHPLATSPALRAIAASVDRA